VVVAETPDVIILPVTTGRQMRLDRLSRPVRTVVHVAQLAAGITLLWASLVPLGDLRGVYKVPLVLVSIVIVFKGVDGLLKLLRGPRFDTGFALSVTWLALVIFGAVFAGVLPLANYNNPELTLNVAGYAPPDLFTAHPLGTNDFGLDLLARAVYGARETLITSTLAALVGLVSGLVLGMSAGYYRGAWEKAVGVLTDAMLAFPALLLLFAVVTVLGTAKTVPQAVFKDGFALALLSIPVQTRLARANTLNFAQRDFVLAARAIGKSDFRVITREILPNVLIPMMSYIFILIAALIVAEGALAFLGLGLQPPQPSWGNMIAEGGLQTLRKYPFVPIVPGLFMFFTVYGLNRIGQVARVRWSSN
jgi:peptide/nickel transport system permease protein